MLCEIVRRTIGRSLIESTASGSSPTRSYIIVAWSSVSSSVLLTNMKCVRGFMKMNFYKVLLESRLPGTATRCTRGLVRIARHPVHRHERLSPTRLLRLMADRAIRALLDRELPPRSVHQPNATAIGPQIGTVRLLHRTAEMLAMAVLDAAER